MGLLFGCYYFLVFTYDTFVWFVCFLGLVCLVVLVLCLSTYFLFVGLCLFCFAMFGLLRLDWFNSSCDFHFMFLLAIIWGVCMTIWNCWLLMIYWNEILLLLCFVGSVVGNFWFVTVCLTCWFIVIVCLFFCVLVLNSLLLVLTLLLIILYLLTGLGILFDVVCFTLTWWFCVVLCWFVLLFPWFVWFWFDLCYEFQI